MEAEPMVDPALQWPVYLRLIGAFFGFVIAGFLIKLVARRLKPRAASTAPQPTKKGAGIAQKLNAFVGFQVLLLSLSFWSFAGFALFLIVLLAFSFFEIIALRATRRVEALGLLALFTLSICAYLWFASEFPPGKIFSPWQGTPFLGFLFLLVAIFDGYSQICGEILGGWKIVPRISPGKTWSGFLGGLVFCAAAALLSQRLVFGFLRPGPALIVGAATGVFAFLGDISASWVKRRLGIKDFSNLLGPQGGVLDRADSLLWLGPAAWAALCLLPANH
jgi:phosphatidate cytidylyltransferase